MKFLKKREVAEMLYISITTLDRKMKSGEIPYYKTGDKKQYRVRFAEEEIKEYMNKFKRG